MYNLTIDITNPRKITVMTNQYGSGTENRSLLNFTHDDFQNKFVDEHKMLLGDVSNEALNITITTSDIELSEDNISLLRPVIRALNINVKLTTVHQSEKATDVTKKFLPTYSYGSH